MGDVERLNKTLAAEHAALYAYGLVAARVTGAVRARMAAAFEAHRARRDQLRSMIAARGGKPVETEASYRLPATPSTAGQAIAVAAQVEDGVAAAYLELVAADDAELRRYAALAVQEAVTRAYGLRRRVEAFPGLAGVLPTPTTTG